MITLSEDPVEREIELGLIEAGIPFSRDPKLTQALDFVLLDQGVYIECKQYHASRISEQMSRVENIIVVQGIAAAKLLRHMIGSRT